MLLTGEHGSRYRRRPHGQRGASGALVCLLLCVAISTAGARSDRSTSFEVASVRLTGPGTAFSLRVTDRRLDLTNYPLRQVLWLAFRIDERQLDRISVPIWTRDVRVDIHATIPEGRRAAVPEMLQRLLTDRFGLRTSVKTRVTDVYDLVVGEDGIRMIEVQATNELDRKFETASLPDNDRILDTINGPLRITDTPGGLRTTTERSTYERIFTDRGTWQIDAARITMAEFASILTGSAGRPVFDKTSLTGLYQFKIELPRDSSILAAGLSIRAADGPPAPTGVSAVKAVERLGLRLEPRRIPLDTIVVDSISKTPTEN
jgi:uncharacterized protein (TIGR03435 family)